MKTFGRNLLLILASTLVCGLVVEIGMRIAGISYPVLGIMDEHRGFAGAPDAEGWQTAEGRAYIVMNGDGLRDREHALAKPPDTLRIAVLGDSYAQALQVDIAETFWSILERDLNSCPALSAQTVEVINFGVGGYSTAQELLTLRHQAWKYDPDVVLLAFLSGNDLGDNTREIRTSATVPYFILKDGELVLDNSYRDTAFNVKIALGYDRLINILNKLRIVQVIKEARRVLPAVLSPGDEQSPGRYPPEIFNDGLQHAVYAPPRNAAWAKAWEVTEAILAQTVKEVREGGADFWLVHLTNGIQVHPDTDVREAFRRHLGLSDLRYPNRRLAALAERLDIPLVDLADPLAEHAAANSVYLHGFSGSEGRGHWNAEGHKAAGRVIAESMCEAFSQGKETDR